MEDKNGLNDIILQKNNPATNNKKIILAVATLGVILIIVVVLMNSLTSTGTDNLPQQPELPKPLSAPEKQKDALANEYDEPLFEDVEVVEDDGDYNQNLSQIAQKLKEESLQEEKVQEIKEPVQKVVHHTVKPVVKHTPKPKHVVKPTTHHVKKPTPKKVHTPTKTATSGRYYIQVGSFSKYSPNKKFLKSITDKGYNYKYHKVNLHGKELNKILVGPFRTEHDARKALKSVRKDIVAGAFLTKI